MIFKRQFWFVVSLVAATLNVAGAVYAYLSSEPVHAFSHGAAAFGFGLLALHLRRGAARHPRQAEAADRTQMLEADLSALERELQETRQRLDFADQLLKNKPPAH